jgi:hypothetical protein
MRLSKLSFVLLRAALRLFVTLLLLPLLILGADSWEELWLHMFGGILKDN